MAGCCEPQGYDRVFSSGMARHDAARYRKSGLRWAARRTVELYDAGVIGGHTLLEVGGGVGDLQVEMLHRGVEHVTSVELSPAYEGEAARLLDEAGLATRTNRVIGDFASRADLADPADIVVMHSVVCCYPDVRRLIDTAGSHARRHLVLSYPRETWWLRSFAPLMNLYPRLRRSDWRFYVHPVATIERSAERAGPRRVHTERNRVDHLAVFTRP